MHVAPLQLADAPYYRALMLEAYELATDAFTSTAAERVTEPLSFWEKRIADPSGLSVAFGAFEGGALIGSVALEFSAKPKTKHKGHVIGMYVAPTARGTRAGRALMQAAVARAGPGGCACAQPHGDRRQWASRSPVSQRRVSGVWRGAHGYPDTCRFQGQGSHVA